MSYTTKATPSTENAKASTGRTERVEGAAIPHNVLIDRHWMLVIPRRAAGWNGVTGNAPAMLGIVCVSKTDTAERWVDVIY